MTCWLFCLNIICICQPDHIGNRIREIRNSKGLSQQSLANLCDLELSQINRIELGIINTSVSHVAAIAAALEIHPKELFEFELPVKKKK